DVTGTNTAYSILSSAAVTATINPTTGVYAISALAQDQGTVTFRCVFSGVTPSITVDKVYSIVKSKAGAGGADGLTSKIVTVTADRQFFTYNGAGAISPSGQTVNFAIGKQNTVGTVSWSVLAANNLATS